MMQNLCKKYESLMELLRILYIAVMKEPGGREEYICKGRMGQGTEQKE